MKFIDTHAHLFSKQLDESLDLILTDAFSGGVEKIICPGLNEETSLKAVEIAKRYPGQVFAGAGIHPIDGEGNKSLDFLEDLASKKQIIAVGEVGLDLYHGSEATLGAQQDLFAAQVEIAKKYDLPIIAHGRSAYREVLEMSKIDKVKGVIHSFEADYDIAKQFLDIGWMISLTGLVTYSQNDWLRDTVQKLPLDRIMLETDAPYLTPQSKRGIDKFNTPQNVVEVVKELARILGVSLDTIAHTTTENAEEFFRI